MTRAIQSRIDVPAASMAVLAAGTAFILGVVAGLDPRLGIIGALGIAFGLVAFANLTAGLVLFMVGIFMESVVTSGAVLSFPKLGGLLLAAAWLIRVASDRERRERTFFSSHPVASYVLAAFLAWGALSILWAGDTADATTDLYRYALNIALVVIIFGAVQTRRDARWILAGFVTGAAVAAVYGLVLTAPTEESAFRQAGASGNPNEFAELMLAGVAFSAAAAIASRRSGPLRVGFVGIAGLCLLAVFLTASRSGIIALAVALLAAIVIGGRARGLIALVTALIAVTGVVYFAGYAPPDTQERLEQAVPGQVPSSEGRFTIWDIAFRMIEDNATLGVGIGNFQSASIQYVLEPGLLTNTYEIIDEPKVAHSIYFHILAEVGPLGAALFFGFVLFSLVSGLNAARRFQRLDDRLMEGMARANVIVLISMLVNFAFHSSQFSKLFWLVLALGPSLLTVAARLEAAADDEKEYAGGDEGAASPPAGDQPRRPSPSPAPRTPRLPAGAPSG